MLPMIRSFIRRRVQIDVGPTDIVLDVGSGDNPHWRADILLEKFISANDAYHRFKGSKAIVDRWTVVGDVEDMPFRDKAFNYVNCAYVLEHVEHLDRAIRELQRVAERGSLGLPFEGAQKLFDFPAHLWYVHSENDKLVFTAKESVIFDPYIDHLMKTMIQAGVWQRFLNSYADECLMTKYWEDQISYEIRGELKERFKQEALVLSEQGLDWMKASKLKEIALSLITLLVRFAQQKKVNRTKINIASLLRCRQCGSEDFAAMNVGYECRSCGELITVLR